MTSHQPPLIVFMDNASGEEVALRVEDDDDFQTFLTNAKLKLGYDIDINLITRNQPVSLNENVYQFLITANNNLTFQTPMEEPTKTPDQMFGPNKNNDLLYILNNDDPEPDLMAERIPFIKYIDDGTNDFDLETINDGNTKRVKIAKTPETNYSNVNSPKSNFVNALPFKLVCNTSRYEDQFTKYLENRTSTLTVANGNKSLKSLNRDRNKDFEDKTCRGGGFTEYSREDILNMLNDSPYEGKNLKSDLSNATNENPESVLNCVDDSEICRGDGFTKYSGEEIMDMLKDSPLPYEGKSSNYARKADLSNATNENPESFLNYVDGIIANDVENQICFICGKFVENIIYLLDNDDKDMPKSSPQNELKSLKFTCENCLKNNFKLNRTCLTELDQFLKPNECLVIKNNQEYIYEKINKLTNNNDDVNDAEVVINEKTLKLSQKNLEFVPMDIGSDGERVTKLLGSDAKSATVMNGNKDGNSNDIKVIEPPGVDENAIDNLEDVEVKQFLGKHQKTNSMDPELKCRFCDRTFIDFTEVMDHGDVHRHDTEDGVVYPCPLCDYGYANLKYMEGHIKTVHDDTQGLSKQENEEIKVSTMPENPSPLVVFMDNINGEEVSLRIESGDDFQTFLTNAKSILGYEVNINSITRNQPVSLSDNIYQFLTANRNLASQLSPTQEPILDQTLEPNNNNDYYILDDGTQIKVSQIQFDNDDPEIDLTVEKIPFIKYVDDGEDDFEMENVGEVITKKFNIPKSPRPDSSVDSSLLASSLPFKLVCNNTSAFEAQFTKCLESSTAKTYTTLNTVTNRNKSPRTLIRDSYKNYDDRGDDFTAYTREEILDMFKDSPVTSMPYEVKNLNEKRRHVRKTDPSGGAHKKGNSKSVNYDGILIGDVGNRNCFICGRFVENNIVKLYLFDNEDQRLHMTSSQKKCSRDLKIICEKCLGDNFKPSRMKKPNQSLNDDEYLVIKNNRQYIFQKTNEIDFKMNKKQSDEGVHCQEKERLELVQVEIGSDGEVVTNLIDNDTRSSEDLTIVKDSSSDIEIIEQEIDESIIDNLEDADEGVKEFLGKYQRNDDVELKCRFCGQTFIDLHAVMEHSDEHKHDTEDGAVYPCPLCDYGYANSKWMKGHIKAAHETPKITKLENEETKEFPQKASEENAQIITNAESEESTLTLMTEVKQEAVESDDEIWVVKISNDDGTEEFESHHVTKKVSQNGKDNGAISINGGNCSQPLASKDQSTHKCKTRRGKKRRFGSKEEYVVCASAQEDLKKPRRRKNKEPSSDPQIQTCHNCNQSFISKVRLKFHMQFHSPSRKPTDLYKCTICSNVKFDTETELFDHVHFQHDKQKRWQCPVTHCGKTFHLQARLTKHSRIHTDTRRYVCVTCGKRFLDKQTLDEHGVTHLNIKPFQCHICLKQLTRRSRLRMHLRAHEEELKLKLVLVCAVCSRAFRDNAEAQEHATKSSKCLEEFAKELKEELDSTTARLSPTSGLVREPAEVEREPLKFTEWIPRQVSDDIAEPLLSTLADEARGVVRVVEIEKAFRCEYCEDVFYLEEGLNTHRLIHKGVKSPFTCHICKVSFTTYSRCTTHKTTHGFYKRTLAEVKKNAGRPNESERGPSATGILGYGGFPVVKHFLCEDCGRSYLHWTYLQVHRRMKHTIDNVQHKCNDCDVLFPNSWSLNYHKKTTHGRPGHSTASATTRETKEGHRIPCRDCDQVFPNKTALYKHRKKEHSGMIRVYNKPVSSSTNGGDSCDQTSDLHNQETAIRSHHLIHSGVRPWACERCPKRFRIRSDLKTHARLKHPTHLAVIEIQGLNTSPADVMEHLAANNIPHDKVIEISKMSFSKGAVSIIPSCVRALSMLGDIPRTLVAYSKPMIDYKLFQPLKGRGIAKNNRKLQIPSEGDKLLQESFPYPHTNVTGEELTEADVQLLLHGGLLVEGNEIVQLGQNAMLVE